MLCLRDLAVEEQVALQDRPLHEDVDVGLGQLVQLALDLLLTLAVVAITVQLGHNVALAILAEPLQVLGDGLQQVLGNRIDPHGLLENLVGLVLLGLGVGALLAVLQLLVGPVVHIGNHALAVVAPDGSHIPADLPLVHSGRLATLGALGAVLAGHAVADRALLLGADVLLEVLVALGLIHRRELEPAVPQVVGLSGDGIGGLSLLLHHLLGQPGLLILILANSIHDVNLLHSVCTLLL